MFISYTNKYVGWQENSGRMTDAKISNTTGYFVEFISDQLEEIQNRTETECRPFR